jgi:hypothetical protein
LILLSNILLTSITILIAYKLLVFECISLKLFPHFFMLDKWLSFSNSILSNLINHFSVAHTLIWSVLEICSLWIIWTSHDIVLARITAIISWLIIPLIPFSVWIRSISCWSSGLLKAICSHSSRRITCLLIINTSWSCILVLEWLPTIILVLQSTSVIILFD